MRWSDFTSYTALFYTIRFMYIAKELGLCRQPAIDYAAHVYK